MRYYDYGCRAALHKLGMAADVGQIPYAATTSRNPDLGVENKRQDFWKSVDDKPFITGEESGLSMPSGSKTGSDYGYGQPAGRYGVGGLDANQHLPDRNKRLSDAMQNAFDMNEKFDQSYAPESPSTQPYGPKMAAVAAPRIASPVSARASFSVPRMGGAAPRSTSGMSGAGAGAGTFKPPTNINPQHAVTRNAYSMARSNAHVQQPAAVGAQGSRLNTTPTIVGGAPVNPVQPTKMPDLTTTAPAG